MITPTPMAAPLSEANLRRAMTSPTYPLPVSASLPLPFKGGRGGDGEDGSGMEVYGRKGTGRLDRFDRPVRPDESISVVDLGVYREAEWDVGRSGEGRGRRY